MKKVYVVDDERSILEALEYLLIEEGYEVKTLSRGTDLLKLNSDLPDLIILDILLSGEDGRQICKILKSDNRTKKIPVVMISAHPSAKMTIKECGADDFLAKPFEINDLLGLIEKHCGNSKN